MHQVHAKKFIGFFREVACSLGSVQTPIFDCRMSNYRTSVRLFPKYSVPSFTYGTPVPASASFLFSSSFPPRPPRLRPQLPPFIRRLLRVIILSLFSLLVRRASRVVSIFRGCGCYVVLFAHADFVRVVVIDIVLSYGT